MNAAVQLSVIVVNWNVRDLLRDCLRSLYGQMRLPPGNWELIVVDNQSSDGSAEMVRNEFPGATLIANTENLGFAKANNQAFQISRGRYVLLLNPDTVVLDHAADRMMEIMESSPDLGALGCRLLGNDGSFQRWTGGSLPTLLNIACHFLFVYRVLPERVLPSPLYLESEPSRDVEVGWVSGACMMLRREALEQNIFDERFFLYGEDIELCGSLARRGWKVIYTPAAAIVHHDGRSLSAQSSEIQVTKIRSLRDVFAVRHGGLSLLLYDVVVFCGFLARSAAFALAARLRPGNGFEARAARNHLYVAESFRALVHRGPVQITPKIEAGKISN